MVKRITDKELEAITLHGDSWPVNENIFNEEQLLILNKAINSIPVGDVGSDRFIGSVRYFSDIEDNGYISANIEKYNDKGVNEEIDSLVYKLI